MPLKSLHVLYHELRPVGGAYSYAVECAEFERHCILFGQRQQSSDSLRPEITFDDGHRSDHEFALPILERHSLQAHFFVTAGWTGQHADYMNWSELRALHASGQRIGAHGWSHTLLTHCTPAQLTHELVDSRRSLEDGLGHSITTMSLPGGRFNQRVLDACWNAGYTEVFTSVPRAEPSERAPRSTVGRLNVRTGVQIDWLESLLDPESKLLARLEQQERVKSAARRLLGDTMYAKLWAIVNHQDRQPEATAGSNR